ncbi:hypothetical protein [Xanthomonas fragariae]|uniref:hypothetical protein n=1 Tax=Xanthomonas fragariae TaxID=48664 RepID=UPI000D55E0A9
MRTRRPAAEDRPADELFRSRLENQIDLRHPLARLSQRMTQIDLVLQPRTKQLVGGSVFGSRTACTHGRKLQETSLQRSEHW